MVWWRGIHSRWSSNIWVIVVLVRVVLWLSSRDRRGVVDRGGDASRIRKLVVIMLCWGVVRGGVMRFLALCHLTRVERIGLVVIKRESVFLRGSRYLFVCTLCVFHLWLWL